LNRVYKHYILWAKGVKQNFHLREWGTCKQLLLTIFKLLPYNVLKPSIEVSGKFKGHQGYSALLKTFEPKSFLSVSLLCERDLKETEHEDCAILYSR